jgi:hypothetical protein
LALALAAAWPGAADGGVRPVVVEADAAGGDLGVRCGCPHTPGLLDVAAAARQEQPGSLLGAVCELPFGVRAVVSPAGGVACAEAVRLIAASGLRVLRGEARDQGSVLLDVGRISADVGDLLEAADAVVLVTRGGADGLVHAYAYVGECGGWVDRCVLVVVGSCPYAAEEIAATVGVARVAFVPWDAKAAGVLAGHSRGVLRTGGRWGLRLMAAAGALAGQLSQAGGESAVVGSAGDLAGRVQMPVKGGCR